MPTPPATLSASSGFSSSEIASNSATAGWSLIESVCFGSSLVGIKPPWDVPSHLPLHSIHRSTLPAGYGPGRARPGIKPRKRGQPARLRRCWTAAWVRLRLAAQVSPISKCYRVILKCLLRLAATPNVVTPEVRQIENHAVRLRRILPALQHQHAAGILLLGVPEALIVQGKQVGRKDRFSGAGSDWT
jgi:hypothetical protein